MKNKYLPIASIVLYIISMILPVGININDGYITGFLLLLSGYSLLVLNGFLGFIQGLSWISNVLFLVILILLLLKKYKISYWFSLVMVMLSLEWIILQFIPNMRYRNIVFLNIGYWVWLASFVLILIYSYRKYKSIKK